VFCFTNCVFIHRTRHRFLYLCLLRVLEVFGLNATLICSFIIIIIIRPRPQQPGNIKYAGIASTHTFVPVAVESMGPLGQEASEFLTDLGRRLSVITDDARETSHLFQRVSVLIQRYNAVAFRG